MNQKLCLVTIALVCSCGRTETVYVDDVGSPAQSTSDSTPSFPRLGASFTSAPQAYDTASFRDQAVRYNIVVVAQWDGWYSQATMTMSEVMHDLKTRSTRGLTTFVYADTVGVTDPTATTAADYSLWRKIEDENWWLYTSGTTGERVRDHLALSDTIINITDNVPLDAGGQRWNAWYADWLIDHFVEGAGDNAVNSNLDGFLTSGLALEPPESGDWNRDGTTDPTTDAAATQAFRRANVEFIGALRQRFPTSSMQLASLNGMVADTAAIDAIAVYDQILDGGLAELIGETWSVETWGGFDQMMRGYARCMDMTRDPHLVIFAQRGLTASSFQDLRYGLASALMDDGYYFPQVGDIAYPDGTWFDELDVDLGHPHSARQQASWLQGVWRRDFDGGIALVNPKGNGAQTVALGGEFRKIAGARETTVNDGVLTTSVTLQDRDGLILLRP